MKRQHTYTSTLPAHLLKMLSEYSEKLNISKNKFIEKALENYFEEIEKKEFANAFKRLSGDKELLDMAEEGIEDFNQTLIEHETKRNMVSEPRPRYGKGTKRNTTGSNRKR